MEFEDYGVRVTSSPTGLGVFASRPFSRRQVIGPILGEVIDDPHYGSNFCMELGGSLSLEPAWPFRLINHSCQPNCQLLTLEPSSENGVSRAPEAWLEVLADIEPGEQLTIDYGWPAEVAIPCNCGRPACRGWIVAAEDRKLIAADGET